MANSDSNTSASSTQPSLFDQEVWRPVEGYEGHYEVSNHGRVRSLDRYITEKTGMRRMSRGRILKAGRTHGYPCVALCLEGHQRTWTVHLLVAKAFLGDPPGPIGTHRGEYQVNHIDGDKTNNRPSNLEWVTRGENSAHAAKNGLVARGSDLPHTKLNPEKVRKIRRMGNETDLTYEEIGEQFGVSSGAIEKIIRGENWKYVK